MKKEYIVREMTTVRTELQKLYHDMTQLKEENKAMHLHNQNLHSEIVSMRQEIQHIQTCMTQENPKRRLHNELQVSDNSEESEPENEEVVRARERAQKGQDACKATVIGTVR